MPPTPRLRLFDFAIVLTSLIVYWVALSNTAVSGFWTGPDFNHSPRSGFSCLLTGWFWYPIGWLANPLFFAGNILLLLGKRLPALITGVLSVICAVEFTASFCREFPPKLLVTGYYFWVISISGFAGFTLFSCLISLRNHVQRT